MLRTVTSYGLLASALFVPGLLAQAQSTAPAKKVVTYDQGQQWPANMLLRTDGALQAVPNQLAFGGGVKQVAQQVNDIAVVPAVSGGQAERIIAVGASGATTYSWQAGSTLPGGLNVAGSLAAVPWNVPALQGARGVRALAFHVNQVRAQAAAILMADGTTISVYRLGAANQLLARFTVGLPVEDFALVTTSTNELRVLVRTGLFVRNYTVAGRFDATWDLTATFGAGSRFVPIRGAGSWQVAWLHKNPSGRWQLGYFADAASGFTTTPVGLNPGDLVHGAFLVKVDADAFRDLVVKTGASTKWYAGTGAAGMPFEDVPVLAEESVGGACEPDLVLSEAGRVVRLADADSMGVTGWNKLQNPAAQSFLTGNPSSGSPGISLDDGNALQDWQHPIRFESLIAVDGSYLAGLQAGGQDLDNDLHVQVLSWIVTCTRTGSTAQEFSIDLIKEEDNYTVRLLASHGVDGGGWAIPMYMQGSQSDLQGAPVVSPGPSNFVQRQQITYHLWAIRLLVGLSPEDPTFVGDPLILGSSLDAEDVFITDHVTPDLVNDNAQYAIGGRNFPFLDYSTDSLNPLRQLIAIPNPNQFPSTRFLAGDPIGVITHQEVGPAPPYEEVPAPKTSRGVVGQVPKNNQ
ncbi:MAG: hypothetical protein MUC36_21730 [Planctomycetes bacterium]|jgi:hypothetical protein|nr:hypothetical protein [Planctomycetota bacterium]